MSIRSSSLTTHLTMCVVPTEQYHSTPETQTDEAYSHPEDLEHFEHHEAIEQREYEREARYQGISVDEAVRAHEVPPPSDDGHRPQEPMVASSPRPRVTRPVPPEKQDPEVKYRNIEREAAEKAEWGAGEDGYKAPQSAAERLRCVVVCRAVFGDVLIQGPSQEKHALQGEHVLLRSRSLRWRPHAQDRMQYKFRRNWGDF